MDKLVKKIVPQQSSTSSSSVESGSGRSQPPTVSIHSSKEELINFIKQQNSSALAIKKKLDAARLAKKEVESENEQLKEDADLLKETLKQRETELENCLLQQQHRQPTGNADASLDSVAGNDHQNGGDDNDNVENETTKGISNNMDGSKLVQLLQEKNARLENELARCQPVRVTQLETELDQARAETKTLTLAITEQTKQDQSRVQHIASLEQQLADAVGQRDQRNAKTEADIQSLLARLRLAEETGRQAKAELKQLKLDHEQAEADHNELQQSWVKVSSALADREKEVAELQARVSALEPDAVKATDALSELATLKRTLADERSAFQSELQMCREDFAGKLDEAETMVSSKTLEIKKLRRQLAENVAHKTLVEQAISSLTEPVNTNSTGSSSSTPTTAAAAAADAGPGHRKGSKKEEPEMGDAHPNETVKLLSTLPADVALKFSTVCSSAPSDHATFLRQLVSIKLSEVKTLKQLLMELERESELRDQQVSLLKAEIQRLNKAQRLADPSTAAAAAAEAAENAELTRNLVLQFALASTKTKQKEMIPVLDSVFHFPKRDLERLNKRF